MEIINGDNNNTTIKQYNLFSLLVFNEDNLVVIKAVNNLLLLG